MQVPRRWRVFAIAAATGLFADVLTKLTARRLLPVAPAGCDVPDDLLARKCHGVAVPVVDGFWDWHLSFNRGAAFGAFGAADRARPLLSLVGIVAIILITWMVRRADDKRRTFAAAAGLMAAGALGNLVERLYFGAVTDFIAWRYGAYHWPTFNVADIMLIAGVSLMLLESRRDRKR